MKKRQIKKIINRYNDMATNYEKYFWKYKRRNGKFPDMSAGQFIFAVWDSLAKFEEKHKKKISKMR